MVWNSNKSSILPGRDDNNEEKLAEEFKEEPKLERNSLQIFQEKAEMIKSIHFNTFLLINSVKLNY